MALFSSVAVLPLAASSLLVAASASSPPAVWFWGSGSAESLAAIAANRDALRGADVFYSVGAGSINASGGFVPGGNKTLIQLMQANGIKVHAIVGCSNIYTLRNIFSSPDNFIKQAIAAAIEYKLDGFNLDFEPYSPGGGRAGVTNEDGLAYATFLSTFADNLHRVDARQLELSLDYFSNLAIWNLPAINTSSVDTIISMDTYVQENATMEAYTEVALGYLDPARLGVGICPQPSETRKPYGPDPCGPAEWSPAMITERMQYLRALMSDPSTSFRMINFCCSGIISDDWWAGLRSFYASF